MPKRSSFASLRIAAGLAILCACAIASTAPAIADETTRSSVVDIIGSIDAGQFAAAESAITKALADSTLDASTRDAFSFERERMRRILLDFTLDEAALKAQLRQKIPDLNEVEFARWKAHGLFEWQSIDGRVLYFNRAASNLFRLSAEALARRSEQTPLRDGPMEAANAHHREILDAANSGHERGLASRKLKVTQSLSVHADAVPDGETVRVWIPYPRAIPGQQEHINFRKSQPSKHRIAPESAVQRTVYLEKKAKAGKPTEFSVSYELTVSAQSHAIDADKVIATEITPELAPFVAERSPHIVFNEALRLFSRQIVGDEKNPWRIAQKLYAAVDQIPWAGAREYSTISNISDYALHAGHADCGQQTLLLMALLRLNGIPSRWQSAPPSRHRVQTR
ncbi:MAG: transglutaminase domain-containing protein, partial [Dokdonella sp.]